MIRVATIALLVLAAAAFAEEPPERVDPADYPDEAAVILRWEQTFTLDRDGAIRRRDHRWTQILSRRAIRGLADPRIDFREGEDEVIVHAARTHLPDGSVLPVPDYSFNIAAPNDVAGWPEWAAWRQRIVSFSGLRPGTVIEFDQEVKTKAGVLPWISAEIRLDADLPVLRHEVVLLAPRGTFVNLTEGHGLVVTSADGTGSDVYRWTAKNLPAARGEPQSPPWRERCPTVAFTTCGDHPDWVRAFTNPVDAAAQADDAIRTFAKKAVKDVEEDEERIDAVIRRLRDTTHLVGSWKTWRSHACRSAAVVFRSAYGSPLEHAAVATAALRSLGYDVGLAVGTERMERWHGLITPVDAAFASIILLVNASGGEILVHPRDGVFRRDHGFGGHTLLQVGPDAPVKVGRIWPLAGRGEGVVSDLAIEGKLSMDGEGRLSGDLTLRLGPLFFDPDGLKTANAQKSICEKFIRRLVPGLDVKSFAVTSFSADALTIVVSVAGKKPIPDVDGLRLIELGSRPMFLSDVPIPLGPRARRTSVALKGAFRESVDLRIEVPAKATIPGIPDSRPEVAGDWGRIVQTVETGDRTVRIRRIVEIVRDRLAPPEMVRLRAVVNGLGASASTVIVVSLE